MKKFFIVLAISSVVLACNSGAEGDKKAEEPKAETATAPAPAAPAASSADEEKALELIGSNDCTTCHAIDKKSIGPAYTEVAQKYEATDANIAALVDKVKKGGQGNWGAIPMTPHPDLPEADAKIMIAYILSLRK
ncbi:MAG: c-type cytochrome [Chitinophagaceae bacterium]|nr:c-type cytochrome [Chitinophagaceae bacterium]